MIPYGLWSSVECRFLRLTDFTVGNYDILDPVFCWFEKEGAQEARRKLIDLATTDKYESMQLSVLPIKEDDRPECHTYV